MKTLIKVKNSNYSKYEELLVRKETLEKEAKNYLIGYIREFGTLTSKAFQLQIECIRQKKAITLCQAAINKGERPDLDSINNKLETQMQAYYDELSEMVTKNRLYKKISFIPEINYMKIKKIYHKLVKMLHPDLNPHTNNIPALIDLWDRTVTAYRANDLDELEEILVLAKKAIEKAGLGEIEIDIPNIDEKIAELEEKISYIVRNDPYRYKDILNDPIAIEEKKDEIRKEIRKYKKYKKELDKTLDEMLGKEADKLKWTIH